ncbi:J domain-containing protein [Luteimonas arsenica]|uniref:J domain-containing protein n=1 Tax=Luteimonas arsenica TaxID=1586242 RepID=UPI0014055F6A|nr:DnaJ domain-containing protein [Luteimonas arsenica]
MTGNDDALDVALGLLRAPALRAALRSRPLPQGVGEVLAIASGSVDAARSAARRTGHGETELVEASRFYVQQVLLAEGADAYRVLGAGRDAGHAVLRDHHRLLLRWLHPDRSEGAQWDSALSTRVNQAWNQLRSDAARRRYDAALPPVESGAAVADSAGVSSYAHMAAPLTVSVEEIPRSRWSTNAPPAVVGLLGLLCVVLAWLAFTRDDRIESVVGEWRDRTADAAEAADAADAPLATRLAEMEIRLPPPDPPAEPVQVTALARIQATDTTAGATTEPDERATAAPAPAFEPAPATATAAAPAPAPAPAEAAAATRTRAPQPATAALAPAALAPASAPAPAPTAIAAYPEDPLQLFLEAEDTIRGITAYLADESSPEPRWLDVPTRLEAAGIRGRLQERHGDRRRARVEVDAPNWSLDPELASMSGAYRLDVRRGTVETGMLRVELARRDRQWRVAGLQLEPAR